MMITRTVKNWNYTTQTPNNLGMMHPQCCLSFIESMLVCFSLPAGSFVSLLNLEVCWCSFVVVIFVD